MNEPTIICLNCKTEIKLTESLAAPLLESTRRQYELKISQKEDEVRKRETAIQEQQKVLKKSQEELEGRVAEKVKAELKTIEAAEAKKAREALADQISKIQQEKAATDELLKDRNKELTDLRQNEIELRKDRQKLQAEKEQFDLKMQRAIDAERIKIRESAQKDADEQSRLKIAEKDKTITDLQGKLLDALRKAEQGSQQLQGEIQELELETLLRDEFPHDIIDPVPKGEHGGDALHRVFNQIGQPCGTILWESKRTKNWSDSWLSKLREDQRTAKADIAVIMSQARPKGIESFGLSESVWIIEPRYLIPVAVMLRQSLIELSAVRRTTDGQQTKMEIVYRYLTGPRFRQRVEAIVEKFSDMQEDLNKEMKVITKHWAKRQEQIRGVIESTAGMYGDLQGIAGQNFQEIEGLNIKMLSNEEEERSFS